MNENIEPGYSTKNLSKSHPFKFDFHFYLSNSFVLILRWNELNSFNFHTKNNTCLFKDIFCFLSEQRQKNIYLCEFMMLTMTEKLCLGNWRRKRGIFISLLLGRKIYPSLDPSAPSSFSIRHYYFYEDYYDDCRTW